MIDVNRVVFRLLLNGYPMSFLLDELTKTLDGEALIPFFQPIFSLLNRDFVAYEVFTYGLSNSPLHNPLVLFNTAERYNLSAKLEHISQKICFERFAALHVKKKLFINVNASLTSEASFKNSQLLRLLNDNGINPQAVVIELTELRSYVKLDVLQNAVNFYHGLGFEVALDDLGAGYSGLRRWTKLLPDYVKLDKHFIRGIDHDSVKQSFVRDIQAMASSLHFKLIVEGVETEGEFNTIEQLGVTLAQGYFFAKPSQNPLEESDKVFSNSQPVKSHPKKYLANVTTAAQIAKFIQPISAKTPVFEVLEIFQHHQLTMLPLVDNKIATGIIYQDRFLSKLFSSRYGLELYGKKTIRSFVTKTPQSIDQDTPLETVSQKLTANTDHESAFIVTQNGEYVGIATLLDLLEEITHLQIKNAKHANPLTLLPGSVPVNEQINQLLEQHIPFAIAYFDLDNFKPFNDVYGYSAGDTIIKVVAETLTSHVSEQEGIVGHIGGDDFIVVLICEDWRQRCQAILDDFAAQVPGYYKPEDVSAGGIYSENRQGGKCFFSLVSLSAGVVAPDATCGCRSHVDIADLANGAKKQAKALEGNSLFVNQRKVQHDHSV